MTATATATAPTDAPSAPASPPILRGKFWLIHTRDGVRGMLTGQCPHCRAMHTHTWYTTSTTPFPRAPHCSRPKVNSYLIAPDTSDPATLLNLREYGRIIAAEDAASAAK